VPSRPRRACWAIGRDTGGIDDLAGKDWGEWTIALDADGKPLLT
jgi:hypothetical protein